MGSGLTELQDCPPKVGMLSEGGQVLNQGSRRYARNVDVQLGDVAVENMRATGVAEVQIARIAVQRPLERGFRRN